MRRLGGPLRDGDLEQALDFALWAATTAVGGAGDSAEASAVACEAAHGEVGEVAVAVGVRGRSLCAGGSSGVDGRGDARPGGYHRVAAASARRPKKSTAVRVTMLPSAV